MSDLGERIRAAQDDPEGFDEPDRTVLTLQTRRASEIEPRDIDFIWPPWLPAGMIGLLAGYGGSGKSTVALTIAAACSTGGTLPDGQSAPLVSSLILAAEDSPEHTIVPRLIGLKADLERIHIVEGIRRNADDPGWVQLRAHVALIERAVMEQKIGLVIIDPVSSYIGDANGDKESDVRSALMPVVAMAERTGAAVLLIRHVSKAGDGVRAASRILGSTAWHDIPRVAWMLADAPDDHQPEPGEDGLRATRRVLGVVKSNLSAKPQARWCVQPVDGPLRWFPDASPVTIDACFFSRADPGTKTRNAEEWLAEHLAGGAKPSTRIFAAAKQAGLSAATLRRAKDALNITPSRDQDQWYWRLPPGATTNVMEGAHEQTDSGHDSEMSTLHNDSGSEDAHHERLSIFPQNQRKPGTAGTSSPPAGDGRRGEGAQDAHIPEMSTFHNERDLLPPTGADDGSLAALSDHDRADVLEMIHELVIGGPAAVASWRAELIDPEVPDLDRRLGLLAASLAEQRLAQEAA